MMKAIRKKDGKVIEVSSVEYTDIETNVKSRYCAADGEMYPLSDLDFSVDEAKETEGEVLSGWVARDADGDLYVYKTKPVPDNEERFWINPTYWEGESFTQLDSNLFPSLTWDSEPMEVEITIKPKKK